MKLSTKALFFVYATMVILDLVFIYLHMDEYRWFSKPLLMPVLILVVWTGISKPMDNLARFILIALLFSWMGDILLQAEGFFIPGLVSFLLAHLSYILYFMKAGDQQKGLVQRQPLYIFPVVLYIIVLLLLIYPYLGELTIPVIIYSITIGWMLVMALNSKYRLDREASRFFIAGAIFFVISDSVLAVNLFAVKNWWLGLIVMITYALAQGLIVKGFLLSRQLESTMIKKEEV